MFGASHFGKALLKLCYGRSHAESISQYTTPHNFGYGLDFFFANCWHVDVNHFSLPHFVRILSKLVYFIFLQKKSIMADDRRGGDWLLEKLNLGWK
jgi:hypothetical protein